MSTSDPSDKPLRFAIFRAADAVDLEASGVMTAAAPTQAQLEGIAQVAEAGMNAGHHTRLLFAAPGFNLAYAWFKSGFPLPLHSHDSDCLYYIVGGSLKLGTEMLTAGDGFFVGADVPYTYTPGETGVEVLEFRTTDKFDIKLLARNAAFWAKAAATAREKLDVWPEERVPPSGLVVGEG